MKKKLSALLCVALLSAHIVPVRAAERLVMLDLSDNQTTVGKPVSYQLVECKDGALREVEDYTVTADSDQLVIDRETASVKAEKAGIYELNFTADGFSKKACIAVSEAGEELVKGAPVFSENFEDGISESLQGLNGAVQTDEAQNHYLYVDARGKILNSALFAEGLSDYVFEADIQTLGCDASSTSQLSVGMRAKSDLRAYRFAYHDVVKYPGSGHTAGTGNVMKNAFSVSRSTNSPLLSAWYYAFVQTGNDDMYDSSRRAQIKPYHWEVRTVGEDINATVSEPETNQVMAEYSAKTTDIDGANPPLEEGGTTLCLHSIAARFDNLSVRPLVKVDALSFNLDQELLSGTEESVSYSVSIITDGISKEADAGMYEIACDGAVIDQENQTVTFPEEGDYFVTVKCGGKYAVRPVTVSRDAAVLNQTKLTLPETVYESFALPVPEEVSVIYTSSDPKTIQIEGDRAIVTRPEQDQTDRTVTITAVLYRNGQALLKKFQVTVKKQTSSDEALEQAIKSVSLPGKTDSDLTLPTEFEDGVRCVWSSSDESLIAPDGKVFPPENNMRVRLTAEFSLGERKKTVFYDVVVLGSSGKSEISVLVTTDQLNCEVGEVVPIQVYAVDNFGVLEELGKIRLTADDSRLVLDSDAKTVTASEPGIYRVRVGLEEYGIEQEITLAFHRSDLPEAYDILPVYSENFDSAEYDEAFQNQANLSVSDGKLTMTGIGQNFQTAPFGPRHENGNLIPLAEYIFDADIRMLACDAGSTGQMSVGMRYDESEDASYRVAHHERIRYDSAAGAVNTASAESLGHMLSIAYGKSSAATSWYLPDVAQSPDEMFSGRGYSKEYHWQVMMTDGMLLVRITDPESGALVQEMSCKLDNLNQKKDGSKLAPLAKGFTVLGAWSTNLQVDNIKISTMKSFDTLEISLDQEIGRIGESVGFKVYSVSGNTKTLLDPSEVGLSCDSSDLVIENDVIRPMAEGEYYIHASKGAKYAVAKLTVSEDAAKLQKAFSDLQLSASEVREDFNLPTELDGVTVRWISSDETAIRPEQEIARVYRDDQENKSVTLTAVLQSGASLKTKSFSLTVCVLVSDAQAVSDAKKLLSLPQSTSSDLTLPNAIGDGVLITWSSSNTSLITETGKVHRPEQSKRVILTAVLKRGTVSESVRFEITVNGTGSESGGGSSSSSGGGYEKKTPVIEAEFSEEGMKNAIFRDLEQYAWAKDAIYSLYAGGIVSGCGDQQYMPGRDVTREEFISMLCRALDLSGNAEACFSDVDAAAWYAPFVSAASHQGIVSGFPDGSFGVGQSITRQDMAVMLVLAMKYQSGETEPFSDHDEIADYAKKAVYALKASGIVVGNEGKFYPNSFLSRAEAAVVLSKVIY